MLLRSRHPIDENEEIDRFSSSLIEDVQYRSDPLSVFRSVVEASPVGMILVNQDGIMVSVNAQAERLFGYGRAELLSQTIEILLPDRFRETHPRHRRDYFRSLEVRQMGKGRDLFAKRKDGTVFPVEVGLSSISTPEGVFAVASIIDLTERKRAEAQHKALVRELRELAGSLEERVSTRTRELENAYEAMVRSAREKEVLLREVHHRVKNNLQLVSSLLSLQSRYLPSSAGSQLFKESQRRVRSIALVHEHLYQSCDLAHISLDAYLGGLADSLLRGPGDLGGRIRLELKTEPIQCTIDEAVPCGLIVTELVTNAIKHAFPHDRAGTIRIALGPTQDGRILLSVHDDGIGLPKDMTQKSSSLGMELVFSFAEQLNAEVNVACDGKTEFSFTFRAGGASTEGP